MKKLIKAIIGFPGRILGFFKGVVTELKFTEFPDRKTTWRLTNIVLLSSLAITVILLSFDTVFAIIRKFITSINT